jgi:methyltransferase (TIGR00027 family)
VKRLTVPAGMPDAAHSAWRVALRRAAHQLFDEPVVFEDPLAVRLLGAAGAEALRRTPAAAGRVWSKGLRAFVVARSAFAEDCLAEAYAVGIRQYCLLGAGLDTFALRNPWGDLRVIELDLPEVQRWKQVLAAEAGLVFDGRCGWVAGDLERMAWPPEGMDAGRPAVFALLGVAPFLLPEALRLVLGRVRGFAAGTVLVFDYRLPREALGAEEQWQQDSLQKRATAKGEPFREGWTVEGMARELEGFARVEDVGRGELNTRYFAGRGDGLAVTGEAVRVVRAWV